MGYTSITMLCPKCKSDRAHRSHRHGFFEHVLGVLPIYPCRCHSCGYRFRRFGLFSGSRPRSAVEREIQRTRKMAGQARRRRELLLYGIAALLTVAFLYFMTLERN